MRVAVRRAALALLVFVSCGAPPKKVCWTLPSPPPTYDPDEDKDEVQVAFLGVGGLLIRWQRAAVMTAPLYSNPTIGELALSEIHPDRQLIEKLMWHDVKDVRAILAGHSHYDHLMDVPYVALHRAKNADVLGNEAMVKLLAPIKRDLAARSPPNRLWSLEKNPIYDVPGAPIRIRGIVSEHSPQVGPQFVTRTARVLSWFIPFPRVTFWRGEDERELESLPVRVGNWPAGTTLAYVVELLAPGSSTVAFRIYYQDSPTRPSYGYPDWPASPHTYDLAVLTMGGATEFHDFPGDIVRYLKARFVMGIHWEDFFNPRQLPVQGQYNRKERIQYAPAVSEGRFLKAVRKAQPPGGRAIVPCPDHVTTFTRGAGGWEITGGVAAWGKGRD